MPYGPVRETPKERALSNAERDRRISKIEAEQAERLRRAIGDEFFDLLADRVKSLPDVHRGAESPISSLGGTRLDVNRKGIAEYRP